MCAVLWRCYINITGAGVTDLSLNVLVMKSDGNPTDCVREFIMASFSWKYVSEVRIEPGMTVVMASLMMEKVP